MGVGSAERGASGYKVGRRAFNVCRATFAKNRELVTVVSKNPRVDMTRDSDLGLANE